MKEKLSRKDINRLFELLNHELQINDIKGEIYLVGGAVMSLVYNARASTRDVDALFRPANSIRQAAKRVALKTNTHENWLNDGVKGFLSDKASFLPFMELSHLTVLCAQPEYLLAMKCLAARIGEDFHDLDDIQYLIRHLNISSYDDAINMICRYYPLEKFPQKSLYILDELINKTSR